MKGFIVADLAAAIFLINTDAQAQFSFNENNTTPIATVEPTVPAEPTPEDPIPTATPTPEVVPPSNPGNPGLPPITLEQPIIYQLPESGENGNTFQVLGRSKHKNRNRLTVSWKQTSGSDPVTLKACIPIKKRRAVSYSCFQSKKGKFNAVMRSKKLPKLHSSEPTWISFYHPDTGSLYEHEVYGAFTRKQNKLNLVITIPHIPEARILPSDIESGKPIEVRATDGSTLTFTPGTLPSGSTICVYLKNYWPNTFPAGMNASAGGEFISLLTYGVVDTNWRLCDSTGWLNLDGKEPRLQVPSLTPRNSNPILYWSLIEAGKVPGSNSENLPPNSGVWTLPEPTPNPESSPVPEVIPTPFVVENTQPGSTNFDAKTPTVSGAVIPVISSNSASVALDLSVYEVNPGGGHIKTRGKTVSVLTPCKPVAGLNSGENAPYPAGTCFAKLINMPADTVLGVTARTLSTQGEITGSIARGTESDVEANSHHKTVLTTSVPRQVQGSNPDVVKLYDMPTTAVVDLTVK
ncbi:MAG: hypothetical protein J5J00_10790 [Deltaproteobacteria bacterium]|nr:hypothetical protein [Deltaproteobacteria bacterium]